MKTLPQYFAISTKENNPLWQKYINWLNETYNEDWDGTSYAYYGIKEEYNETVSFCNRILPREIKIITLEQWNSIINNTPMTTEQYIAAQKEFEEKYPVGTKVRITRTAQKNEDGWDNNWVPNMMNIGHESTITYYNTIDFTSGVRLNDGYNYPFYVLEPVEEELKVGDIVCMVNAGGWSYHPNNNGCLAKVTEIYDTNTYTESKAIDGEILNPKEDTYIKFHQIPLSDGERIIVRKATQEEINSLKQTNMTTQKITRKGLKEIHSVACSDWKGKIERFALRNPLEDEIEFTQEEVKTMFAASNASQEAVLNKYFKKVVEFNASMLKAGEVMYHETYGYCIRNNQDQITWINGKGIANPGQTVRDLEKYKGKKVEKGESFTIMM